MKYDGSNFFVLLKGRKIQFLFLVSMFCFPNVLFPAEFHIRAREHFDRINIVYNEMGDSEETSGIGPTFNFWFEEPYDWAVGLLWAVTFIGNDPPESGEKIGGKMELQEVGIEGKYWFFTNMGGLYTRLGYSNHTLKTKGSYRELESLAGHYSIGWEFKFSKIGLAFEVGKRELSFDHEIGISLLSSAIGVHFYGFI